MPGARPRACSSAPSSPAIRSAPARWGDEVWLVAVGGGFKPGHPDETDKMLEDLRSLPARRVRRRCDRLRLDQRGLRVHGRHAVRRPGERCERASLRRDRFQRLGHHQRRGGRDDPGRPDRRPEQPLGRGVRRHPDQAAGGSQVFHRRECRRGRASGRRLRQEPRHVARRAGPGRGRHPQAGRQAGRGVAGRGRAAARRLGGLHPLGLRGGLESRRPDLGLPLPRLSFRARRHRDPPARRRAP